MSQVLKQLGHDIADERSLVYTIVALSYRGFWTSYGKPNQIGIESDAAATLEWVLEHFGSSDKFHLIIWGQSIGAGVATALTARFYQHNGFKSFEHVIDGLILETPFVSVRRMLETLYPQKWLPYRYLWPFLRNHWDSRSALIQVSKHKSKPKPAVLILQAGKDELVSAEQASELKQICLDGGFNTQLHIVPGALHTRVLPSGSGQRLIATFIEDCVKGWNRL